LELRHLLLDLLVCVIVSVGADKRDRLGAQVAAADQPLISLKDVAVSSGFCGLFLPAIVGGSGC